MATVSPPPPLSRASVRRPPRRRRGRRVFWTILAVVVLAVAGLAAAVFAWSGIKLAADPTALTRVDVQPFGGTIEQVRAVGPDGRNIPVAVRGGRLFPLRRLTPGEQVTVVALVRRSHWIGWAIGDEQREQQTMRAPTAGVSTRWLTVQRGAPVRVSFDRPVSAFAYGNGKYLVRRALARPQRSVSLGPRPAAGTIQVSAAARPWERLGAPAAVSWFPPAELPVAVIKPAPGAHVAPATPITLTFSKPVADALGSSRPTLSPSMPGGWRQLDSHTLVFRPTGLGAGFGSDVRLALPRTVDVTDASGNHLHAARRITWTVPPGSMLRLQQLLAQAGYLPLDWTPAGAPVARTSLAQVQAAVDPPKGHFSWRYANTPPELRRLWSEGTANQITRGAVMMFQHDNGLTVDAIAGQQVWRAILAQAVAGKRRQGGYSYVYVHSNVPQSLTLWHNGQTVLTSPGNTGVPAAPTQLGTFQVFEHIPVGTMSGTNPDGSHYNDPGIRWISYFNGGDAIHAFNRASFGTPQSLGCVELPLDAAARVWPYTPIGTLVTVEQ